MTIIQGSLMNATDLERAKVHEADACLVLANKVIKCILKIASSHKLQSRDIAIVHYSPYLSSTARTPTRRTLPTSWGSSPWRTTALRAGSSSSWCSTTTRPTCSTSPAGTGSRGMTSSASLSSSSASSPSPASPRASAPWWQTCSPWGLSKQ